MASSPSIIIPTYNGSRFIADALSSVYAQTTLPGEIVLVDDASTDDTIAVAQASAANGPVPLRIIRLEKNSGGPARPLNVGMSEMQGDVAVLLEQDDRLTALKVAEHARFFSRDPDAALVFGQARRMDADGVIGPDRTETYERLLNSIVEPLGDGLFRIDAADAFKLLTKAYIFGGAGGTSVSRRAWAGLGGFDEAVRITWDYDFAFRAAAAGWNFGYTPALVFHRRWHGDNLENSDQGLALITERLRVLRCQAMNRRLPPALRRGVRAVHRRELLAAAYAFRHAFRPIAAFHCVKEAACRYGPSRHVLAEAGKIAIEACSKRVWRRLLAPPSRRGEA